MEHRVKVISIVGASLLVTLASTRDTCACGGMFSPDATIFQHTERIIVTDHGDGTISAILQIGYEGEAEDFAWVLPIPEVIPPEAVEVVEDGAAAFDELQQNTN